MTIKNTRKDIASEPGDVVLGIYKKYDINSSENDGMNLKIDSSNQNYNEIFDDEDNYKGDLVIKLRKQDQYTEESTGADKGLVTSNTQLDKVVIPLSKLVTKKHLYEYFKARFIDIKIRVIDSVDKLPSSNKPEYGDPSYLFLVYTDGGDNQNTYTQYVWDSGDNEYKPIREIEVLLPDMLRMGDIVDGVNSNLSTKVLSAKQGKLLSERIGALSDIHNDILSIL